MKKKKKNGESKLGASNTLDTQKREKSEENAISRIILEKIEKNTKLLEEKKTK